MMVIMNQIIEQFQYILNYSIMMNKDKEEDHVDMLNHLIQLNETIHHLLMMSIGLILEIIINL